VVWGKVEFALYVDDLVSRLRDSGYGIHVGSLFVGCVLYVDDTVLLSTFCDGLRKPVYVLPMVIHGTYSFIH